MKKLAILFTVFGSLFILSACYQSTSSGGDTSLTSNVNVYEYKLSDSTQTDIQNGKEKIIITEFLNYELLPSNKAAQRTPNFIHSVNQTMEEKGYTIISTDTNGMGKNGEYTYVTLIFTKKDKE